MKKLKMDRFLTYEAKDTNFKELNKNTWQSFIYFDFEKYINVKCYEYDFHIDFNSLDYNNPKVYDYLINNNCIFVTSEKEEENLKIMKPDNIFKLSICLALCNPHPNCINAFNGIIQKIPNDIPELFYEYTKDTFGYFVFEEQRLRTLFKICLFTGDGCKDIQENIFVDPNKAYEKFCFYMNRSEHISKIYANKGKQIPDLSDSQMRTIFNQVFFDSCLFKESCAMKCAENTYKAAYVDWIIQKQA